MVGTAWPICGNAAEILAHGSSASTIRKYAISAASFNSAALILSPIMWYVNVSLLSAMLAAVKRDIGIMRVVLEAAALFMAPARHVMTVMLLRENQPRHLLSRVPLARKSSCGVRMLKESSRYIIS